MGDALNSLETQYIFLTNHLDEYLEACGAPAKIAINGNAISQAPPVATPEQNKIKTAYVNCRKNYWGSLQKIFHDDDPGVVAAVVEVKTAQTALEHSLDQLNDVTKVLNVVTTAVKIGGELAALAV